MLAIIWQYKLHIMLILFALPLMLNDSVPFLNLQEAMSSVNNKIANFWKVMSSHLWLSLCHFTLLYGYFSFTSNISGFCCYLNDGESQCLFLFDCSYQKSTHHNIEHNINKILFQRIQENFLILYLAEFRCISLHQYLCSVLVLYHFWVPVIDWTLLWPFSRIPLFFFHNALKIRWRNIFWNTVIELSWCHYGIIK